MTKGYVYASTGGGSWHVCFAHLDPRKRGRDCELYTTHALALSEYRRDYHEQVAHIMNRRPLAQRRAVLTTDGLILTGDQDHRPGDPIIGPDNKVHYIETVYPPNTAVQSAPAGQQTELPLFFD